LLRQNGNIEIVKLLLKKELKWIFSVIWMFSRDGAAKNGHSEVVKLLLEKEQIPI